MLLSVYTLFLYLYGLPLISGIKITPFFFLNNSLNDKQNTITGASSTVVTNNLTANRVLLSNSSGKIAVSSITNTQLGYLSGVSSNIQTQLNSKMTLVASTKSQTSSTTYSFTMDNGSNMYLVAARSWGAVYTGAMVWLVSSITSNYQFAIPLTESGTYAPTISVSGQKVTIKSGIDSGIIYSIYKL